MKGLSIVSINDDKTIQFVSTAAAERGIEIDKVFAGKLISYILRWSVFSSLKGEGVIKEFT